MIRINAVILYIIFLYFGVVNNFAYAQDSDDAQNASPFEIQNVYTVETPRPIDKPSGQVIMQSELIKLKYAKAFDVANILKDKSSTLLSSRGSIRIDPRTNSLLLKDSLKRIEQIKQLVTKLDVPVSQVLIEARIVNIAKDTGRDIGIRLGLPFLNDKTDGALDSQNFGTALDKRLDINFKAAPVDANPAQLGLMLHRLGRGLLLDLELSALESEGQAEVVASPRLMTTNNYEAVIESGEDIPYQEATLSGATAVAFKKAALSLRVKPQITADDKLLMNLLVNQDFDSGRRVQGVPVILTKSISTNVLVNNGETVILGGIYKKDKHNAIIKVPILGNIPLLGVLFRRIQVRFKNEELLIFITPRIIKQ